MISGSVSERPGLCWVGRSSIMSSSYPTIRFIQLMKGQSAMPFGRLATRFALALLLLVSLLPVPAAAQSASIDEALTSRARRAGWSRVIVTLKPGAEATTEIKKLGGRFSRKLQLINGMAVELPNGVIKRLAAHPAVARLDFDRPTTAHMAQVANMVGARYVRRAYGYDGAGVGIAVIDSGVANWHDDLTYSGSNPAVRVSGNQRVAAFVDFVNGRTVPYDDYGHGTHVSGVISGNGFDSQGQRAGIAPASHLVSLKVLDHLGRGLTSDVIAAIEYAVKNRSLYNIRVINLSVGAAVTTSYNNDPLALAAKRAVDAGLVVVAAAGNHGRTSAGAPLYGGITAPGNAPWVLTVGASSHGGTLNRLDDTHAGFSSRGPTRFDYAAKPDVLAPGTGIVSLSAANSTFYLTKTTALLSGTLNTATKPYLSLSGTSMAAPVVAGSVALMMQANPGLTPNLVKAILQYTAQAYPGVDYMTQGGGFLNTKGAVDLARHFASSAATSAYPADPSWSRAINWGTRRVANGSLSPFGSAWAPGVTWGAAYGANGDNVVWGTASVDGDNVVWGTASDGDNVVWGTLAEGDNVVWGTTCGGADCFNVVWGTNCDGGDCYNVVWGTADNGDNVVWGTASVDGDNVVWGTADAGDGDNVVWGSAGGDNVVWGTSGSFIQVDTLIVGEIVDEATWQALFKAPGVLDSGYELFRRPNQQPFVILGTPTTSTIPLTNTLVNQPTAGGF